MAMCTKALRARKPSAETWTGPNATSPLSGLYGVLRPLDRMQPYRLEMGTRLATTAGNTLYQYWGSQCHLSTQLRSDTTPVIVNLASQEYFRRWTARP